MGFGRPRKYNSVEELQGLIDAYFVECDNTDEPYTITGLGLALDMSRQGLINYEKGDKEVYGIFFDAIKKAKARCENYIERGMIKGKIHPAAGCFNMKNNYGWVDKVEIEQVGDLNVKIEGFDPSWVSKKSG